MRVVVFALAAVAVLSGISAYADQMVAEPAVPVTSVVASDSSAVEEKVQVAVTPAADRAAKIATVPRSRHIARRVEDRPQLILALRAILPAKQRIGQTKAHSSSHVARISTSSLICHPSMLERSDRKAKTLNRYKVPKRL